MDNPIIILVFWVIINILIKSSRDKKKAEQARRKSGRGTPEKSKSQQSEKTRMNTGMKNFRKALDDYKEQIERELNPDKQQVTKPETPKDEKPGNKRERPKLKTYREGRFWQDEKEEESEDANQDKEPALESLSKTQKNSKGTAGLFDIKNDILKGVVYSEILDKPKSMKNKRSPF